MRFLTKFFGGMTLTGYTIAFMVTLILCLSAALGLVNHSNNKLRAELGGSEQAIMQLVETVAGSNLEIEGLIKEVERCANARASAEKAALKASQELQRLSVKREDTARARNKEIAKDLEVNSTCDCPVPARTTRLLIDAACSANRDTTCP